MAVEMTFDDGPHTLNGVFSLTTVEIAQDDRSRADRTKQRQSLRNRALPASGNVVEKY